MQIWPTKYKIFLGKGPCHPQNRIILTEKGLKLCIYGSPNTHSLIKRRVAPCNHQKLYISVNLDQKGPEIMHI